MSAGDSEIKPLDDIVAGIAVRQAVVAALEECKLDIERALLLSYAQFLEDLLRVAGITVGRSFESSVSCLLALACW